MTLDKVFAVLGLCVGAGGGMGLLIRVLTRSKRDTVLAATPIIGSGKPRGGLVPPSPPALEGAAASWADAAVGLIFAGIAFLFQFLGVVAPAVWAFEKSSAVFGFVVGTPLAAGIAGGLSCWLTKYRLKSLMRWYNSQPEMEPTQVPGGTMWVDDES